MGPHPKYFDDMLLFKNLIDKSVLNIDAPRVGAFEVAKKLFKWWWPLERVSGKQCEELFGFRAKTSRGEATGVFLGLPSEYHLPRRHQPGSFLHLSTGVDSPLRIDSRMPGIDRR